MTYSIVAGDLETGHLGVGVASRVLAVGALVPWLEPGVGAVATQAFVDVTYGARLLSALRRGSAPGGALDDLTQADPAAGTRQVAVVDATGRIAIHHGEGCVPEARHITGEQFSCQANMMSHPGVPEAMAKAFTSTAGSLAERIIVTLDAAEAAGGDLRGRQSAAVKIVAGTQEGRLGGLLLDLRVDDHPDPLVELRRLADLHRASGWFGAG